jgi:hypothetical protein
MLNPFFTANRWDWQPHCKLGQSTWLCCVQVPCCCWCKATPWKSFLAPLFGAVAKLAGINLRKFGSFSYWFNKPWFHNWGKTCWCADHNLLLGFPTGLLYILDDPLRHWRNGKYKTTPAPQRVNCSNLNKNSINISKFLDACSSTSIVPTFFFCSAVKNVI